MRLGQCGVQSNGSRCRLVRPRKNLSRREVAEIAERGIRIGQSRVGASVARIAFDRVLEILGGLLQTDLGPLIPLIAALDIELVGFGALGPDTHFAHLADEASVGTESPE